MNSLYPSIKFTLEIGKERLNFLELTISIEEGLHQYNIHRKTTSIDNVVQWIIVLFPNV